MTWHLTFTAEPFGKKTDLTAWKRGIAMTAQAAMMDARLRQFDGPLSINATFNLTRPRSAAKTAKAITRPGGFDLAKIVDDGLRGIIYPSTRGGQIVRCNVDKAYTDGPGSVVVTIAEVA